MTNTNLEKGAPYRFKPGRSGNPGGRPKKRPISDRYAELAEAELPEKERIKHGLPEGATYGDALASVMYKLALEGKADAAREIREAIEGKTGQRQPDSGLQEITVSILEVGANSNNHPTRSYNDVVNTPPRRTAASLQTPKEP